jgi:hypothetical protein
MADTVATMPPAPDMDQPMPAGMSMSEAMDVLDEFHIKRSDMDRVSSAIEAVMGPSEPGLVQAEAEADMAKEMFSTDRDRKAM